jgi:hypothetical protein
MRDAAIFFVGLVSGMVVLGLVVELLPVCVPSPWPRVPASSESGYVG